MTPNIPLVAWRPDGDPTQPGILAEVENLVPTQRGFVSDLGGVEYNSLALGGKCYGGRLLTMPTGLDMLPLATQSALLVYTGDGSLVTATRSSGGAYNPATSPINAWRFEQFGEYTIAVQRDNILQETAALGVTRFSNVTGGPAASTVCVASNFVMVANTTDPFAAGPSGFRYPDGWWCSALGDHTDWTPDLATQCDQGRLRETPGPIIRLFAYGPDVLAFKRNSMIRGRYVNRPADGIIWQWTTISTEVGIVGHDAICQVEGIVYFMSTDGVYAFNGSALRRVDSFPRLWFQRKASNINTADNLLVLTQAVYDPQRRAIRWHFTTDFSEEEADFWTGGCLTYHVDTDRWGYSSIHQSEWAMNVPWVRAGINEDGIYTGASQQGTGSFTTRAPAAYVHKDDHTIRVYSNTSIGSGFITGDIGDDDTLSVAVRARLRFLRAPTSATVRHYHRMNLGGNLTQGELSTRTDGKYDFAHAARWHRLSFEMVGAHEVTGMRVAAEQAGKR